MPILQAEERNGKILSETNPLHKREIERKYDHQGEGKWKG